MLKRTLRTAKNLMFHRENAELQQLQKREIALKARIKELEEAAEKEENRWDYHFDGLAVAGKTVGFMKNQGFLDAYNRGMNSGHAMGRERGSRDDIGVYWRVYVAMWVAEQCAQIPGDFVECGTNTGLMSLAICQHLQFQDLAKHFYLFDTFAGTPMEQASESEIDVTKQLQSCYFDCFDLATKNFAEYQNVTLVRGMIPDSLQLVDIGPVSYLHVDLNLAYPERKAMEFFWERLTPGAMMLLDDYGFKFHDTQKTSADEFARSVGKSVLELPTGQGLVIK